ncbi:MAG: hypothetical protein Ct9H90mP4_00350 [Gammaproteobacteria bacterium]|nr:MAG: hypothetical protein Ct9H90mP4_00350 [Gammaproteobacteria bacterium]
MTNIDSRNFSNLNRRSKDERNKVAVTGGAGQIAYSLLPKLVSGETFGKGVKVNLRLKEIPQVVEKIEGTIMELLIVVSMKLEPFCHC